MNEDKKTEMSSMTPRESGSAACSPWRPLFEHMEEQYAIVLTEGDMDDIAMIVDKTRMSNGGVAMILVNCLRHLSNEEMIKLGKDIADRCGYSFQENVKIES